MALIPANIEVNHTDTYNTTINSAGHWIKLGSLNKSSVMVTGVYVDNQSSLYPFTYTGSNGAWYVKFFTLSGGNLVEYTDSTATLSGKYSYIDI